MQSDRTNTKEAIHNNMNILAGSFARWIRCLVVTDPCGYAPPARLASCQNSCAIIVHLIMNSLLSGGKTENTMKNFSLRGFRFRRNSFVLVVC